MAHYKSLKDIRRAIGFAAERTAVIDFEGMELTVDLLAEIRPRDTYLAERNTGVKLLTCRSMSDDGSYVIPVEGAYPYDTHECAKVIHGL